MLSLIITPGQGANSAYQMTKRDITVDEAADIIRAAAAGDGYNKAGVLAETVCLGSRLHVLGVTYCKKEVPVSLVIGDHGVTKKYRGPIVAYGFYDPDSNRVLIPDFAKDVAVEPRYKDDVVCIPSVAEWKSIPEETRKLIANGNWNWSRDLLQDSADVTRSRILFDREMSDTYYIVTDDVGGVAPVFDLTKLPEDVADKIRNAEPNSRGIFEFDYLELVRLTDNTYVGRTPFNDVRNTHHDLKRLHGDQRCESYEVCELRKELNGPYLEAFIEHIRNFKEDN